VTAFWIGIAVSMITGAVVNEFCDISPWLAEKIVRRSAQLWAFPDRDSANELANEWAAVINDAPGKLTKLGHALRFAFGAQWRFQQRRMRGWLGSIERFRAAANSWWQRMTMDPDASTTESARAYALRRSEQVRRNSKKRKRRKKR
jgi:hypothetical protein